MPLIYTDHCSTSHDDLFRFITLIERGFKTKVCTTELSAIYLHVLPEKQGTIH